MREPIDLPIDIDAVRASILDPTRTYAHIRGAIGTDTLKDYIHELTEAFEAAPRVKTKPESDGGPDVVQPWVWDDALKTFTVHRFYRFPHAEHGTLHGDVHQAICTARDEIESAWPNTARYEQEGYRQYHIIAQYKHESAGYDRHTDVPYAYDYPMLQCWLQITEPGTDFDGGDLILYTPGGQRLAAISDLGVRAGDVLFFDKRTEHEVEACRQVEGGLGRWIGIIGAMAPLAPGVAA